MVDESTLGSELRLWLRKATVEPDDARADGFAAPLLTIAVNPTDGLIEDLVRLAFSTKQQPSSSGLDTLQGEFRTADSGFDVRQNLTELRILAAATLIVIFRTGSKASALAAMATSCASMAGSRSAQLPMDLAGAARTGLHNLAVSARARPNLAGLATAVQVKIDPAAAQAKAKEESFEGVATGFGSLATATTQALTNLAKRQADLIAALSRYHAIQDEELQVLWWLMGERSWALDRPFAKVSPEERCLVLPNEVAAMTKQLPGPLALPAMLARAGLGDKVDLTVPAVVNKVDDAMLRPIVDGRHPSPITHPIELAISRRLETGSGQDWIAGWTAATGLDANRKFSSLQLGQLFYQERLLAANRG